MRNTRNPDNDKARYTERQITLQIMKNKIKSKNNLDIRSIWIGFLGFALFQVLIGTAYGMSETENDQVYLEAESYFSNGNFTHAMKLYDSILEDDPTYANAIAAKGAVHHRWGDFSTAIEYYDRAIAINSTNPYFLSDKGNALLALGFDSEGVKYLKDALDILPTHVDALNGLANAHSLQGNYEQEIVYRTSALILEPDNQEAMIGLGNAYFGLNDYDAAILQYQKVIRVNPENTSALNGIGNVFLKTKEYGEAILQYDRSLFIDPDNINALQGKSQAYVSLGENEIASQLYKEIEIIKNENGADKSTDNNTTTTQNKIPNWIKSVFKWFSEDLISEEEVILGLQFLIQNGIIKID